MAHAVAVTAREALAKDGGAKDGAGKEVTAKESAGKEGAGKASAGKESGANGSAGAEGAAGGAAQAAEAAQKRLARLCAFYLLTSADAEAALADPVARFHLNNGARLERINPMADLSRKGLKQAHGVMVNYLYDLDEIEANHERFMSGEVSAARAVTSLL